MGHGRYYVYSFKKNLNSNLLKNLSLPKTIVKRLRDSGEITVKKTETGNHRGICLTFELRSISSQLTSLLVGFQFVTALLCLVKHALPRESFTGHHRQKEKRQSNNNEERLEGKSLKF